MQLKGFVKTVVLAAGASQTVSFPLKPRDLSIWDVSAHSWQAQSGEFEVGVGGSSSNIQATASFTA